MTEESVERFATAMRSFETWASTRFASQVTRGNVPPSVLSWRSATYLNCNLGRFKALIEGVGICAERRNLLAAALSLRAAIECLGGVAYFGDKLLAHYEGRASDPIEETLARLILGTREKTDSMKAVNVLTQVARIDPGIRRRILDQGNDSYFSWLYDFLSEACHPNMLGLVVGEYGIQSLGPDGEPIGEPLAWPLILSSLLLTVSAYRLLFDEGFGLLAGREPMPLLVF